MYRWEAELRNGEIMTKGGDLADAVRVSIIPHAGSFLPRHDLAGLKFVRRFTRHFKRTVVGGFDKDAYFAAVERNESSHRKAAKAARDAKGYVPPQKPVVERKPQKPAQESVECVVCEGFRVYIRSLTGTVLVTPPDYELYL